MATIVERPRKDGGKNYQVTIRIKGHPTTVQTFQRKTDAKQWAQETESAIRNGRFFASSEMRRKTLGELIDRYLKTVAPKRPEPKKERWQLGWWKKHLGARLLVDITPVLLTEYREKLENELGDNGKPRSASTINKYISTLSQAIRVAIEEWGWMKDNPTLKIKKPKIENERIRFLSEAEKDALLKACRKSESPYLYCVVLIGLTTGMRFAEILALKWPDVDFERNVIRIMKSKNKERRVVPMADMVQRELQKIRSVPRIDTDYVFARADGKKPIEIRKRWYQAVEASGIEDFNFHDLRHTAASYLTMSGTTPIELMHICGWKTMQMAKRYAHLSEQHTHGVVNRMVEKFM